MRRLRVLDRNRSASLAKSVRKHVATLTAAALALGFAASSSDAHAYVVKRTSSGELVHWEQRAVDYTFDPSVDAYVVDAIDASTRSMASWSSTVGAPDLRGHLAGATVDPPKVPGFDQKNGVFYMAGGYAPAGRALAITVLTYDNVSGRILDADIIVNGSYKFEVLRVVTEQAAPEKRNPGAHPSNTDGFSHQEETLATNEAVYDLHHVVAHELGHTLGMNDEMDRKDALMYRYSSPNDPSLRAPAPDDIAGLAELYSTKLDGTGNGCGNATVAPKKPSLAASHFAMATTFGFLLFLMARGRKNRRARVAFVLAAAVAAYALFPSISKDAGNVARASQLAPGHARAKVLDTTTTIEGGLFKTVYKLATTACHASSCPKVGEGFAWGGSVGNISQDVGGQFAPSRGDDVDVTFAKLPSALAPLSQPLAAPRTEIGNVRVVTLADR